MSIQTDTYRIERDMYLDLPLINFEIETFQFFARMLIDEEPFHLDKGNELLLRVIIREREDLSFVEQSLVLRFFKEEPIVLELPREFIEMKQQLLTEVVSKEYVINLATTLIIRSLREEKVRNFLSEAFGDKHLVPDDLSTIKRLEILNNDTLTTFPEYFADFLPNLEGLIIKGCKKLKAPTELIEKLTTFIIMRRD